MQLDKILSLDRAVTFERPDPLHVIRLPVALYGTHKRVIIPIRYSTRGISLVSINFHRSMSRMLSSSF